MKGLSPQLESSPSIEVYKALVLALPGNAIIIQEISKVERETQTETVTFVCCSHLMLGIKMQI